MKTENKQNDISAREVIEEVSATINTDGEAGQDLGQAEDKETQDDAVRKAHTETSEEPTLKEVIRGQAREDEEPMSTSFTLRKILGGDILNARLIRSQVWLIIIIVFFIIIYISNRYSVQKNLLEIDRLNKELQTIKYKALTSNSQLTEKCRETHVLEQLKQNNDSMLKMPNQMPYIIQVPEK